MTDVATSQLYYVKGTASGNGYTGSIGFWVMGNGPRLTGPEMSGKGSDVFPGNPEIPWLQPAFLAKLKELFDGVTYGDGTTQTTVTSPVITLYSEDAQDVTP